MFYLIEIIHLQRRHRSSGYVSDNLKTVLFMNTMICKP